MSSNNSLPVSLDFPSSRTLKLFKVDFEGSGVKTYNSTLYNAITRYNDHVYELVASQGEQFRSRLGDAGRNRSQIMDVFNIATSLALDELSSHTHMTAASSFLCLNSLQTALWHSVINPMLRDQIFVNHAFNQADAYTRVELFVKCEVQRLVARRKQSDLDDFRKYITYWVRAKHPDLIGVVDIIAKSDRPWCVFPGKRWLVQHGMTEHKARMTMRSLRNRKLLLDVGRKGKTRYCSLDLRKVKSSKTRSGVSKWARTFPEFFSQWNNVIHSIKPETFSNYVIRDLKPRAICDSFQDDLTRDICNTLFATSAESELRNRRLILLRRIEEQVGELHQREPKLKYMGIPQSLMPLLQPMIERRMLVHVIVPLIAGLPDRDFDERYMDFLQAEIDRFFNDSIRALMKFFDKLDKKSIEFADKPEEAYKGYVNPDKATSRFKVRRALQKACGRSKPISRWFAEKIITEFSNLRGKKTAMAKYATLPMYARWYSENLDGLVPEKLDRALLEIYMALFEAKTAKDLIFKMTINQFGEF